MKVDRMDDSSVKALQCHVVVIINGKIPLDIHVRQKRDIAAGS